MTTLAPPPSPPPSSLPAALPPAQEAARLKALHDLQIAGTEPEERFDRITRLAAQLFDVPMALISLVDADCQWFKSRFGIEIPSTAREHSFCAHAIAVPEGDGGRPLVVPDLREDERFANNPLVVGAPHVRAYVGQVITAPGGQRVGTLCLLDRRKRQFERRQLTGLHDLARLVENELHNVELNALIHRMRAGEERLRDTEVRYRDIFENLVTGVCQSTLEGTYLNANPALARIFGYDSPAELMANVTNIGRQLYVDPERRLELLRYLDEHGEVRGFEAEMYRRDGSTLWVSQNGHRVCDAQGRVLYYMGNVEDITSRRYAALAQAQAAETAMHSARLKSEFLSTMSHEIRTPMHGIIGMANLLLQMGLNAEQEELTRLIGTCGDNLLSLINNVLDFSKIESGAMEIHLAPHELGACLKEVITPLNIRATENQVKLAFQVDPRIPQTLVSDAGWVRQILNNLVGNAVKFTPAGGSVDVIVTGNPLDAQNLPEHVAAALEPYPEAVPWMFHFTVRDTGIGVPEEKLHRLFKPFSQADAATSRKYGGTGLGLAICHRLCEMLGGSIWLESEVGQGSSFEFTIKAAALPVIHQPPSPEPAPAVTSTLTPPATHPAPNALAGLRILLTEDNAVNQRVALGLLRQIGRTQGADAIANNGREAVEALGREAFDIILMDVQMPEMDGFEATRAIRRQHREGVPYIIAMTANAMEGDREKCLEAGMDDYLSKPVKAAQLQGALEKATRLLAGPEPVPVAVPKAPVPAAAPAAATATASDGSALSPAALDPDSLNNLRALAADGDEGFLQELADLFLEDAALRLLDLDRTLAANEAPDFTRAAHSIKGACANFGATELAKLCAEVEARGRAGDLTGAAPLLPELRRELERVRLALAAATA